MRITTDIGQDLDALRDVPAAIVLDEFAWPPLPSRRADFDGVTRGDAAQRELGLMLLDLYAVAAQSGIGEFECRFFRCCRRSCRSMRRGRASRPMCRPAR